MLKRLFSLMLITVLSPAMASVPAMPVMSLYQFNGDLDVPYYSVSGFTAAGPGKPVGYLAQGSRVIPCVVIKNGQPLTDKNGTPYVGFEVVMDAKKAKPSSVDSLLSAVAERENMLVDNHHCTGRIKHVMNAKRLINRQKPPFFVPPGKGKEKPEGETTADSIVRAFHNSPQCQQANNKLTGRRQALADAWSTFISKNKGDWGSRELERARNLDYVMRTAIYEGHIGRGCSAYGACERNIIALSLRNRAIGQCLSRQGCGFEGDFVGASSSVSQYNIWDEYLTQTSGLTACFLRADLADREPYGKLQAMYAQSVADVESILYGSEQELRKLFPGIATQDLVSLRHYYHPPAMGACYPQHGNVEYISAAVATKGDDHILVINKRIKVDDKRNGDYRFRDFIVSLVDDTDVVNFSDRYNGFAIDGRKVSLRKPSRCTAYGVSSSCRFSDIGRYRKTPFWLSSGKPIAFRCKIQDTGESCGDNVKTRTAEVGGSCDIEMMPVSGVN